MGTSSVYCRKTGWQDSKLKFCFRTWCSSYQGDICLLTKLAWDTKVELCRHLSLERRHAIRFSDAPRSVASRWHIVVSDCPWDIGNLYEILITISETNMKQKNTKDIGADETQDERSQRSGRVEASVAVSGKDTLYHVRPYQKSCDTIDSKKFQPVWKVRKCAARDDESRIAMIGTWFAEGWVPEVVCIVHPSLMGLLILRMGACSNLRKLSGGRLFKYGRFLGILR